MKKPKLQEKKFTEADERAKYTKKNILNYAFQEIKNELKAQGIEEIPVPAETMDNFKAIANRLSMTQIF